MAHSHSANEIVARYLGSVPARLLTRPEPRRCEFSPRVSPPGSEPGGLTRGLNSQRRCSAWCVGRAVPHTAAIHAVSRAPEPDEQPRRETRPRSPPPEKMVESPWAGESWYPEVVAKLEEAARAESVVRAPCAAPRWRKRWLSSCKAGGGSPPPRPRAPCERAVVGLQGLRVGGVDRKSGGRARFFFFFEPKRKKKS